MMPKMFIVLALLAHGAVSVRSSTWLSEGHLEADKVEKKPVRSLFGWFSRKLEERKNRKMQKLVDYVQGRLKEEAGMSATRRQVEEFIRTMRWGLELEDWTTVNSGLLKLFAKLRLPLDVEASAVAFCGELVKAADARDPIYRERAIKEELHDVYAEGICSQVLTGDLSMSSAPEWAVKAAEVAEMDGQQHPFGRLDGVAWKHSLKRVCHEECEELVQGIRDKAEELAWAVPVGNVTIEEACADKVVRHVEAEILGCCSKSCGWNGQFCSFFPFLSSEKQTAWQAECCSELNILNGSTRQRLCDTTLSPDDRNKSHEIVDQRPNKANDREILGQDESPASKSWSLMEGPLVANTMCPPPIDLHKIYLQAAV